MSIKEVNKNNVTSKRDGTEENDLNMRRRRARVTQCYTMQKREQRNKSLQSNAMSRCNSYKLINEKYSVNVANYE